MLRIYKFIWALLLCAVALSGCTEEKKTDGKCVVVLEECPDVIPVKQNAETCRGKDVSFILNLKNGCVVSGTDYQDYEISKGFEKTILTLKNVRYSTVVKLYTTYEYRIYYPNGGIGEAVREEYSEKVKNVRIEPFVREGYIQTGWNTKADGSGEHIGFGSRSEVDELYAEWAKENKESDFNYICTDKSAAVTGYCGQGEICVIPDTLGGKTVRTIKTGAFADTVFRQFICSDTVQVIEAGAFTDAKVQNLVLFDNLQQISDESFAGCQIKKLCLNAKRAPVYAGSYFSAFPDKCERLFSLQNKKIVLFSGSSGRYGYDSAEIEKAFKDYQIVNMGTYAYTNAMPQLEIILHAMEKGDILIEAPEFDAFKWQFCESNRMDQFFFSLVETDYSLIEFLDLRKYTGVFDALNKYLYEHSAMEARDYSYRAFEYDDNGNRIDYPTYNMYGDYVLKRPNSDKDEMHRVIPADYTVSVITEKRLKALNKELEAFTEKGVSVLFTYAPRNRSSLTEESTWEKRKELEKLIVETLTVPVISNMKDSLYSGIYFYEIDNHLSCEGAFLRTKKLIADIKKWMTK